MANEPVMTGKISQLKFEKRKWGLYARLFTDWGDGWNGHYVVVNDDICLSDIVEDEKSSCVGVVDSGKGIYGHMSDIKAGIVDYALHLKKGFAFQATPPSRVVVCPSHSPAPLERAVALFIVEGKKRDNTDVECYEVTDPNKVTQKPYEYESLGQEIFTYPEDGQLGLLRFTFAGQGIPIHRHPHSARVIKGIAGDGFTYIEPNVYPMTADDYALIPKKQVHTNGPKPGSVSKVWAFQMPWVVSKIDEHNIGGSPQFVQYEGGYALPQPLWKTTEDFKRIIDKLGNPSH